MPKFFRCRFAADFMPHISCLRERLVVAVHAASDGPIALFPIPAALTLRASGPTRLAFRRVRHW